MYMIKIQVLVFNKPGLSFTSGNQGIGFFHWEGHYYSRTTTTLNI